MGAWNELDKLLDARGMRCPIPVLKARKLLAGLAPGDCLTILATDPMAPLDLKHFCGESGHEFLSETGSGDEFRLVIRRR